MTDDEYRERASKRQCPDNAPPTVDDRAEVKRAIDGSGAWVQVWVWVSDPADKCVWCEHDE